MQVTLSRAQVQAAWRQACLSEVLDRKAASLGPDLTDPELDNLMARFGRAPGYRPPGAYHSPAYQQLRLDDLIESTVEDPSHANAKLQVCFALC